MSLTQTNLKSGGNLSAQLINEIISKTIDNSDAMNNLSDNTLLSNETYQELTTENKKILSAIDEINEKIRGYIQNLQIGNAILTDTDGFTLTTSDGSPLVLEDPVFKFDNVVSDVYTTITSISDDIDYTNSFKEALTNSRKIVCLSKGKFNIYDIRAFQSSNYIIKGYSSKHTVINYSEPPENVTLQYQAIQYQNDIHFENIHFDNFQRIMITDSENITFKNCVFTNFTLSGIVLARSKNIRFINCKFDEIGTEITQHTNSGFAIQLQKCSNIQIESCFFNEVKGNSCVQFLYETDNFTFRNNIITNSVFGGISGWYSTQTDTVPIIIENNVLMNIGFGTPSPNNVKDSNGQVTGVGCAGIYCGSSAEPAYMPYSIVRNNLIIKCREVSIEGSWAVVENNTVMYSGVESDIRYTPSRSSIHFRISPNYKEIIKNNTVITDTDACITTVGGYDTGEVVIQGNYFYQSLGKTNFSLVNCNLKSLVIKDNFCNSEIYIHNNRYKYDYFVLDNECSNFRQIYPIIFNRGYVDLREGHNDEDIRFVNITASRAFTRNEDNSLNIGRWGFIDKDLKYNGYLFDTDTDCTLWVKMKYNSECESRAAQLRTNPDLSATVEGTIYIEGTDGEDKVVNVLLKPYNWTDGNIGFRVSNSSNWLEGDIYYPLKINYVKLKMFIKESDE